MVPLWTVALALSPGPMPIGDPASGIQSPLLKRTAAAAGVVPGADESNKRLSVVRARRRATTGAQCGAHDG